MVYVCVYVGTFRGTTFDFVSAGIAEGSLQVDEKAKEEYDQEEVRRPRGNGAPERRYAGILQGRQKDAYDATTDDRLSGTDMMKGRSIWKRSHHSYATRETEARVSPDSR